jgi:hypothetical protein
MQKKKFVAMKRNKRKEENQLAESQKNIIVDGLIRIWFLFIKLAGNATFYILLPFLSFII